MEAKRTYSSAKLDVVDMPFYVRLAQGQKNRDLMQEVTVPKKDGKAFVVDKGNILRITCMEGPQVAVFARF